ncbi:MAG: FHA domain-containing protein [Pseudomonadota bacterium]
MAFKLIVEDASGPQGEVLLRPGANTLGRAATCNVMLDSPFLSRRHARLVVSGDTLEVFDLDSHNGLFVNGAKVRKAGLVQGDALFAGSRKLVVVHAEDADVQRDPETQMVRAALPEQLLTSLDDLQALALREALSSDDATVRNLAMMYRVTERDARNLGHDEFLRDMLDLLRESTLASLAILLIQDDKGVLMPRAILREGDASSSPALPSTWPLARKVCDEREILFTRDVQAPPGLLEPLWSAAVPLAVLCAPLIHENLVKGCVLVARGFQDSGYADAEVELVAAIAHLLAGRLSEEPVERPPERSDEVERMVRSAHPGRMADRLMEYLHGGPFGGPSVTREQGVVVYAELTGVEDKLDHVPIEAAEKLMAEFHARALEAADRFGGHLEAAFACGVALVFTGSEPHTALTALRAAVRVASLNLASLIPGFDTAGVRVGVDVGPLTTGLIGRERVMYMLMGKAARVAARVADVAQSGQVVATAELRTVLGNQSNVQVVALGPHALRGFARPVELFLLDDPALRGEEGAS